jgi:CheY-like chemotaxis protein
VISVLVVEDSLVAQRMLTAALQKRSFTVAVADGVNEALGLLAREKFDVILTDLRLGKEDGIDLLKELRRVSPHTRPILMSAFASARDHQRAMELGAVRVLCKPFSPEELFQAVQQAVECETGFRGSVYGLSLTDMLQMYHYSRRSVTLTLLSEPHGHIHLRHGEVIHAEWGDALGEPAFRLMLGSSTGSFETSALQPGIPETISGPMQGLLLDSLRQNDEADLEDSEPVVEADSPTAVLSRF